MKIPRVAVIGGGVSGLAAAHRIAELSRRDAQPCEVIVLEARLRLGGAIETRQQGGMVLEGGPDAFLTEKPWAIALCQRLGLADELIGTQEACRRSFVLRRGRLVQVPEQFYLIAPGSLAVLAKSRMVSWPAKIRMAAEWFVPPRRAIGDESVAAFVSRRFGREAFERIGQPMVSGIYSADATTLSCDATLPQFRQWERQYGSVLKALRAQAAARSQAALQHASGPRYSLFMSLRRGLSTLVDALRARLPEGSIRCGVAVERVERRDDWTIRCRSGESIVADAVCLAAPAPQSAAMLASTAPALSQALAGIPFESVATVNAAFHQRDVPHALDGFGFVVPHVEQRRIIGCSFASVKFPHRAPKGMVVLRAFLGGALHRDVLEQDDASLEHLVREELRHALGISIPPVFVSIHRHERAMPQYHVGHLDRVAAIEAHQARWPGLALIGNSYRGIGLPDCIHRAELEAERLWAFVTAAAASLTPTSSS